MVDIFVQPREECALKPRFFKTLLLAYVQQQHRTASNCLHNEVAPSTPTVPEHHGPLLCWVNYHTENTRHHTWRREWRRLRIKSAAHAQRFLPIYLEIGPPIATAMHALARQTLGTVPIQVAPALGNRSPG